MALFAENPGDGVHYVGFAATVGPDDASGAGAAEGHDGALTKRLKANDFHFSQLKQDFPFWSSIASRPQTKESETRKLQWPARPKDWGKSTRGETTFRSSRGGSFEQQVHPKDTGIARRHVWQVLGQRPSRLAQGWRYGKKQ